MFCKQRQSDGVTESPDSMVPPYGAAVLRGPSTRKPARFEPPRMEWFPTLYHSTVPGDSCSGPCPRAAKLCPNKVVAKSSEESERGYAEEGQALSGVSGVERYTRSEQRRQNNVTRRGFSSLSPELQSYGSTLTQPPPPPQKAQYKVCLQHAKQFPCRTVLSSRPQCR